MCVHIRPLNPEQNYCANIFRSGMYAININDRKVHEFYNEYISAIVGRFSSTETNVFSHRFRLYSYFTPLFAALLTRNCPITNRVIIDIRPVAVFVEKYNFMFFTLAR